MEETDPTEARRQIGHLQRVLASRQSDNDRRMTVVLDYMAGQITTKQLPHSMRKEQKRVSKNNKRARKRGSPGRLTLKEWLYILMLCEWSCYFCGSTHNLTMEHLFPVSEGGPTCRKNCVPACRTCNHTMEKKH